MVAIYSSYMLLNYIMLSIKICDISLQSINYCNQRPPIGWLVPYSSNLVAWPVSFGVFKKSGLAACDETNQNLRMLNTKYFYITKK